MGDLTDHHRIVAEIRRRRQKLDGHRGGTVQQHRQLLDEAEWESGRGNVGGALGILLFLDVHRQPIEGVRTSFPVENMA